jgi:hypothetical protein
MKVSFHFYKPLSANFAKLQISNRKLDPEVFGLIQSIEQATFHCVGKAHICMQQLADRIKCIWLSSHNNNNG